MRYVFVNYHRSPGFTTPQSWFKRTRSYAGILEQLSKRNTVISVDQIDYTGNQIYKGIDYRFVSFNRNKTFFPWRLNRYVAGLAPDIVMIQGLHNPLQTIQLRIILNKHAKIFAHHHAEKPFTGLKKYIQRLADRYTDGYFFASKGMGMDWIARGNLASPGKIHEMMEVSSLFYPVDRVLAKRSTGVNGSPVFLWVGRLNVNKDPLNVVKGFLQFLAYEPAATLYMIYHTSELLDGVTALLTTPAHKAAVTLVGEVEHDELLYWYNSAGFIISGSHYEGSGTAVCEAMSCGCIPIVTDIFSFRMITNDGACGLLYQPGNEADLLAALLRTKSIDHSFYRTNVLNYFKSNLSFEAIAKRIEEVADAFRN